MITALERFKTEITNFYVVSLLNIVFSALAIAFGVQYGVTAITGTADISDTIAIRILTGMVAMISFGLGISWLLATIRVFEDMESIREILCSKKEIVSEDLITCLIVRMLAHYRERKQMIRSMIRVSLIGGGCFIIFGIEAGLDIFWSLSGGSGMTIQTIVSLIGMILMLGVGSASILSSLYLRRFTRVYDRRLHEIDASECTLQEKLGPERA